MASQDPSNSINRAGGVSNKSSRSVAPSSTKATKTKSPAKPKTPPPEPVEKVEGVEELHPLYGVFEWPDLGVVKIAYVQELFGSLLAFEEIGGFFEDSDDEWDTPGQTYRYPTEPLSLDLWVEVLRSCPFASLAFTTPASEAKMEEEAKGMLEELVGETAFCGQVLVTLQSEKILGRDSYYFRVYKRK